MSDKHRLSNLFSRSKPSAGKEKKVGEPPAYVPPQGPPPSSSAAAHNENEDAPPSYEGWMSVRENPSHAGLPPPPTIHHDHSHVHNAPETQSKRALEWCRRFPLWPAQKFDPNLQTDIANFRARMVPAGTHRYPLHKHRSVSQPSVYVCSIDPPSPTYKTFMSGLPIYSAIYSRPYEPGSKFTAYFEIKVLELDVRSGDGVAIGFVAPPYPEWRLPGWERASFAVHGDDGHRFVNDAYGGREFTTPFAKGEVVGVGIEFSATASKDSVTPQLPTAQCFMVRNNQRSPATEWDLHEEIDAEMNQPGGVKGLEGNYDLHAAVGLYGLAKVEVRLGKDSCQFWP